MSGNKLSVVFSAVVTLLTAVALLVAGIGIVPVVIGSTILFLTYFAFFRLSLYFMLFRDLERVWNNVRSMRKSKSSKDPYNNGFVPKWIDEEVKLLLKEKTTEIGKMKEVERFRKDFLGSVAHELRTPIFGIQGYLHTLLDGADNDERVRARFLKKAANNADSLTIIIEDLITISRIESNEIKLHRANFDLIELIEEVLEALDFQAGQSAIELSHKGLSSTIVYADVQKVKQIFTNLVSNSIKYGKEDGQTIVRTFDMKDSIMIEVADTGVGINKEDLPRIFERFFRVDKNRSRQHGNSTGLGLSIVKHFLEAHGQEINVRSSPGKGSIFSFSLPKSLEQDKQLKIKT